METPRGALASCEATFGGLGSASWCFEGVSGRLSGAPGAARGASWRALGSSWGGFCDVRRAQRGPWERKRRTYGNHGITYVSPRFLKSQELRKLAEIVPERPRRALDSLTQGLRAVKWLRRASGGVLRRLRISVNHATQVGAERKVCYRSRH